MDKKQSKKTSSFGVAKLFEKEKEIEKEIKNVQAGIKKEVTREKELLSTLKELEEELAKSKADYRKVEKETRRYRNQFKTIEESRIWNLLSPARKIGLKLKGDNKTEIKSTTNKVTNQVSTEGSAISPIKAPEKQPLKDWQKRAKRKVQWARRRLLNLGFTERGYEELHGMVEDSSKPYIRNLAARELALWHANQRSEEDAKKCLEYLEIVKQIKDDPDVVRQTAIMEAECHDLVGNMKAAREAITEALKLVPHPDLYLAAANLEYNVSSRVDLINKSMELFDAAPIYLNDSKNGFEYDKLDARASSIKLTSDAPKVTVIMPVYNAEEFIRTAIESVLVQTWTNLEILIVDDCGTDGTEEIIQEYIEKDHRVKYHKMENNGGPYVARNWAMQNATGDFITCNDSDDWSHPEKIEKQVLHLIENPEVMANTSQQARATSDLKFYRRGNFGAFIIPNMSSVMFRREKVLAELGVLDPVRFGADSEFVKRMKKIFGDNRVVDLPTGPMSFQRQTEGSLTGNSAFGYHGFFMGARKEYNESQLYFYSKEENLKYDSKQERPFAIPEPMWPTRESKSPTGRRHFDVIIASEFRMTGGSNISNMEEIKAQKRMGLRTGLIQMSRYDLNPNNKVRPEIRDLIDGDQVQMIVYGEKVSCDLLILRYPPILQDKQRYIPDVEAKNIRVVVNQPPMSDYSENGVVRYDLERSSRHLREYFGEGGIWSPIGPLVRNALYDNHNDELSAITLSKDDWTNIIDVDEWKRESRPIYEGRPKIGRVSRDHYVKWPADPEELISIYPTNNDYEVHVLGGGKTPEKILGEIPSNWNVLKYGELDPKEFLAGLDVFVYFTHPDWVEAFGRVIIEAMAVGVPVILPPQYKELFGNAAIYASPDTVQIEVDRLMSDDKYYNLQVKLAHDYVENQFGYTKHAIRLSRYLENGKIEIPNMEVLI
ncbi:glycosyltransferase [Alkalihalobacillus sp. MEB130]|uniref:glycosyltransferase n=1 Tax=Alkalihalobacillus sp. MEB130 TaxID=2976704 RepID=UPI0028DE2D9C|nr:glycosyltransferase [Alkalihalobacillus sp. MEB130]MDT8860338.1 glycosyltransferase [Alkalihalobacillus sp. MEB130]